MVGPRGPRPASGSVLETAHDAAAREVVGLAVAVGAQQAQVLEPVVEVVAVHVVKGHGERSTAPLGDAAVLATIVLEAVRDQAMLEVAPCAKPPCDEQVGYRRRLWPGTDLASEARVVESLP